MRFLIALCFITATSATASDDPVIRLSEPVATTPTHEIFGAPMAETGADISLGALIAAEGQHLGQTVRVTTEITQVCRKKGCFFIARDGEATARITFADYGFFIPTDSAGKQVTLVGTLDRQPLSQAQADHYAADLGAEPAESAPFEYQIVATSVMIPYREGP